jgi:hypothetical protein
MKPQAFTSTIRKLNIYYTQCDHCNRTNNNNVGLYSYYQLTGFDNFRLVKRVGKLWAY